jgi:hypothetical protein
MIGGGDSDAISSELVYGRDAPESVVAPDVPLWAVHVENRLPGSCPSAAPGVRGWEFTDPPCPAVTAATIYLDARSGAYVGVDYGGALGP